MHIGQTRIITLTERGKIDSAKSTCKQLKDLKKGDKFDFTIPSADAYGEYDPDQV
jgi:FKBP-type peptidyl-prolyl cis-trans isomerase 2